MQKLRSLAGFAGGSEDGFVVALQHLQPVVDVAGMIVPWTIGDVRVRAQEGSTQLSDELLKRVALAAKPAGEVAR